MVQRKIDYYFKLPIRPAQNDEPSSSASSASSSRTTFLDLPYSIRRRIYLLVDITRFCPINFNQEGPRVQALQPDPANTDYYYTLCLFETRRFYGNTSVVHDIGGCVCPRLPTALLYVSRAISEEVSRILYSENSFTISRSDVWGLKPLRRMSKQATASLRRLTIRLNNGECIFALPCQGRLDFPPCCPLCKSHRLHDAPLSNKTRQAAPVLHEWEDLCRRWAPNITPGQLRLNFVCDTRDLSTAQQVVDSLTSHVSPLRECSIRLSLRQDFLQQMLARSTALRLLGTPSNETDQSSTTNAYSYYLPSEIIAQIFEYSDLIAPIDLEWWPNGGFAPFDCCRKCTASLDCCTCRRFHGAYSSTCACWTPPTALFLVSRRVHDIATDVFYSRNRFVVLPKNVRLDYTEDHIQHHAGLPRTSPLARFLDRVPHRAHTLIRCLGLALPMYMTNSTAPDPDGPELHAWRHTLDLVRLHLNLPQLQLSIYAGDVFFADYYGKPNARAIAAAAYRLVLGDLSVLHDLRDFFVYLSWPHQTRDQPIDTDVAASFERQAMGPDYDAYARGKWDRNRRPQLWYHGSSRERKVLAVDGTREWPFADDDEDNYWPEPPSPCDYVWTLDGTMLDEAEHYL